VVAYTELRPTARVGEPGHALSASRHRVAASGQNTIHSASSDEVRLCAPARTISTRLMPMSCSSLSSMSRSNEASPRRVHILSDWTDMELNVRGKYENQRSDILAQSGVLVRAAGGSHIRGTDQILKRQGRIDSLRVFTRYCGVSRQSWGCSTSAGTPGRTFAGRCRACTLAAPLGLRHRKVTIRCA
jgi:hypothetical protein